MKHCLRLIIIIIVALYSRMLAGCNSTTPITDPKAIIGAMFDDLNKGRAEDATKFFSEESQIITAFGQPKGLKKINDFFKLQWISLKSHFEILEINVNNENVMGKFTVKNINPEFKSLTELQLIAIISNGKIMTMTWTTKKQ